jgi:heme-degrading monooxygenase HmoA
MNKMKSTTQGLRHIVMWTLKEEAEGQTKAQNMLKAREVLMSCSGLVPGIEQFEVGLKSEGLDCTSDVILNSVFKDAAALTAYQNHPDHIAIKPFMKAIVAQRQCMDFWN